MAITYAKVFTFWGAHFSGGGALRLPPGAATMKPLRVCSQTANSCIRH